MAISTLGFDGSLNESGFATVMALAGTKYSVAGPGDYLVSAVPGARSVSIAAGIAYGVGVAGTSPAPITQAIPTPAVGGWYLLVLRRDWSANSVTSTLITAATTTAAAPTTPPLVYPTMEQTPGVRDDQPLAWVWAQNAGPAVTVFDIRARNISDTFTDLYAKLTALAAQVAGIVAGGIDAHTVDGKRVIILPSATADPSGLATGDLVVKF